LQDLHPGTPPGLLANPAEYDRLKTIWPAKSGDMLLHLESTDAANDKFRLEAIAMALYDANSKLVDDARQLNTRYQTLLRNKESDANRLSALSKQAEQERALVEASPGAAQIEKLTNTDKELEAARVDAANKLKAAQADLDKLQQEQANASKAPASDPSANDPMLAQMTKDAATLSARLADARKGRADLAAQARQTLDSAYEEFKKQLDATQDAAKTNPELANYINAATNLQQAIRDLTDQYIQHQQQDYTALNELKNNFIAKITDRKATLIANDPKLKEMTERKEILTRKYNEAINSGLDKEASDIANELKLNDTMMKSQEELVTNDPAYNDIINGLQLVIDQKQKSINDEKAKTDEKLAQLKQSFNKSAAGVAKLPA